MSEYQFKSLKQNMTCFSHDKPHGWIQWKGTDVCVDIYCKCGCSEQREVSGNSLRMGNTQSCGCLQKERAGGVGGGQFRHGDTGTRLYYIWRNMKRRCLNLGNVAYKYYGGRGILVYARWKDDYMVFKAWAMSHGYQDNLTIDRINNDGNYIPDNCQFITRSENSSKPKHNYKED